MTSNLRSDLEKVTEWFDNDGYYDVATEIRNICHYGSEGDVSRLIKVMMDAGNHLSLTRTIH